MRLSETLRPDYGSFSFRKVLPLIGRSLKLKAIRFVQNHMILEIKAIHPWLDSVQVFFPFRLNLIFEIHGGHI